MDDTEIDDELADLDRCEVFFPPDLDAVRGDRDGVIVIGHDMHQ